MHQPARPFPRVSALAWGILIATTLSAYLAVGLVYNDISSHDIAECRIDRTIVEDSVAAAMDPARFYLNRDQLQFANFYVETGTVLDPEFSQNERCFTSIQIHVAIFVEPKDPRC
jgi:hypothetical protein